MACEFCEHCQTIIPRDERVTIQEGYSYHKKCHKCYVCSETNLTNAEVFKGVLFCSSCAQRIFQGCSTARKTKATHGARVRRNRTRSRSHKRARPRTQERRRNSSRDGVIEAARLAGSTTTTSEELKKEKSRKTSKPSTAIVAMQVETTKKARNYVQQRDELRNDSMEMGTTTEATQELLRELNCLMSECRTKSKEDSLRNSYTVEEPESVPKKKNSECSDLRVAELGASTEIANMALRKSSRLKRRSESLVIQKQESDYLSGADTEWIDSAYSTIEESTICRNVMDRRLGSILRIPLKFFRRNILDRSSLISIIMSSERSRSLNIFKKFKQICYEEITEHQVRGVRRLYSTINHRQSPLKLGWVDKVSKLEIDEDFCTCSRRCKHFKRSHSYRCMRAKVMRLAGPTPSELKFYRHKIKRFILPKFLRRTLMNNKNYPAIKMSQACGISCSAKT